jgi:hypothetical protein
LIKIDFYRIRTIAAAPLKSSGMQAKAAPTNKIVKDPHIPRIYFRCA